MRLVPRPSASMVVAVIALFAALGGVGYAAIQIPANSVGSAQLRNGSVSNWKLANHNIGAGKIVNGAIGARQIDATQVQARITGTCATGAMSSIGGTGSVACTPTVAQEFNGPPAPPVTVPAGTTATAVATESLPGGSSYLVLADPYVQITGASGGQSVTVTCTLAVGPATTAVQTRSWMTEIGSGGDDQTNAIPLVVSAPSSVNSITANVTCTRAFAGGTSPTITVSSNITALQTASNTTAAAAR